VSYTAVLSRHTFIDYGIIYCCALHADILITLLFFYCRAHAELLPYIEIHDDFCSAKRMNFFSGKGIEQILRRREGRKTCGPSMNLLIYSELHARYLGYF
jgi:hypothetical protein